MPENLEEYLMLIKIGPTTKGNPKLVDWIQEIDRDYMERYPEFASVVHAALIGPWDFALWFRGTHESAIYLASSIARKAPGEAETVTMPALNLDRFRGLFQR